MKAIRSDTSNGQAVQIVGTFRLILDSGYDWGGLMAWGKSGAFYYP